MRFLFLLLFLFSQNLNAMTLKFQEIKVTLSEPYELTLVAIDSSDFAQEKKFILNFVGVPEISRAYVPRDLMQKVMWGIIAEQQQRLNGDDKLELKIDGVTIKGESQKVLNHIFNPSIALKRSPTLEGQIDLNKGFIFTDKSQITFRKVPKKVGDPIEVEIKLVLYNGEIHNFKFQAIIE